MGGHYESMLSQIFDTVGIPKFCGAGQAQSSELSSIKQVLLREKTPPEIR